MQVMQIRRNHTWRYPMEGKTVNGVTYSHAGQENINFYAIDKQSDWCRKNTKVKFKRYGIIIILINDIVLCVINPKKKRIHFDNWDKIYPADHSKVLSYLLTKLIKDVTLDFYYSKLSELITINGITKSPQYNKVCFTYSELQVCTEVAVGASSVCYTTYTIKNN